MTKLDLAALLAMYRTGVSAQAVARHFGTSMQTVIRRLRILGEPIRKGCDYPHPGGPKIPLDETRLRELRDQGLSTRAIGESLGASEECVRGRMISLGIPRLATAFPGESNPAWKGGRRMDDDGYILLFRPDHPFAVHNCVREHRLVMEAKLGRYLRPEERVHHKDNNTGNNSADNLELFATNADHLRATLKGRCPKWTEDGKRRIRQGHLGKRLASPTSPGLSKTDVPQ
jgi:hypothetical protein